MEIPGGDIKRFSCRLTTYGFEADCEFWKHLEIETDLLWPQFKTNDLIEARLEIQGFDHVPKPAPKAIVLQGLVTEKRVHERVNEQVEDTPVLFRRYHILFADAAQVLWRQHRPSALYADMTMKEILAAHCAPRITLEQDWPEVLAGDEVLATAILDRLLHRSQVLNIKGRSYRLRDLEHVAVARS